jgi:DNA-binding CsgD family transcriptional regulator
MITPIDLQNLSVLLPKIYISKSMGDFPSHVLSILEQILNLDRSRDGSLDTEQRSAREPRVESELELADLDFRRNGNTQRVFGAAIREYPILAHYFLSYQEGVQQIASWVDESIDDRLEIVYWRLVPLITLPRPISLVFADSEMLGTIHAVYLLGTDAIVVTVTRCNLILCERDRYLLELAYPHVWQAYQNAIVFTESETKLAQRDRALDWANIILVSAEGKVESIGERASQILDKYFVTSTREEIPEILADWLENRSLIPTYTNGFNPPTEPLEIVLKGHRLQVTAIVNPAGLGYILLLKEQDIRSFSIEQIQEILGLSRREAEVLFWIAQDRDNQEISQLIECSLSTVKKHIEKIYQKLGVKSRTAAAIHALKQVGMLDISDS